MRRLAILIGGSLGFWLLIAVATRWYYSRQGEGDFGDAVAVYSGVAIALCLLPTTITLVWSVWGLRKSPEQQLAVVLGGTGIRMFVVLAVAYVLYGNVGYFQQHAGFWMWILIGYLFTLALETMLVLGGQPKTEATVSSGDSILR